METLIKSLHSLLLDQSIHVSFASGKGDNHQQIVAEIPSALSLNPIPSKLVRGCMYIVKPPVEWRPV